MGRSDHVIDCLHYRARLEEMNLMSGTSHNAVVGNGRKVGQRCVRRLPICVRLLSSAKHYRRKVSEREFGRVTQAVQASQ